MSLIPVARSAALGVIVTSVIALPIVVSSAAFAVDATFPPTANVDYYTTPQDVPLSVDAAGGLLANDLDGGNAGLVVDAVTLSDGGTLAQNPDGSFTFTPDYEFVGTAHFIYSDIASGFPSNSTDVWIEVTYVIPEMVGVPDFYTTPMDTPLAVYGDGRPIDNDLPPMHVGGNDDATGEISMNVYGEFDYIPAPGFVGTKTFNYWLTDDNGNFSDPILITIEVTGPPAIPEEPQQPGTTDSAIPASDVPTGDTLASTGLVSGWLAVPGLALLIAGCSALLFTARRRRDILAD